jgi:hypothetical protein
VWYDLVTKQAKRAKQEKQAKQALAKVELCWCDCFCATPQARPTH